MDTLKLILITLCVLACTAGCATKGAGEWIAPAQATGNNIAESKAYNAVADAVASSGQKQTRGEPNQLFRIIRDTLAKQVFSLDAAAVSHDKTTQAMLKREAELSRKNADLQRDYAKLYHSTGAKAERFVRKAIAWIVGYLVLMVVLRAVGLLSTGWIGTGASVVSTVMGGPIQWFFSLMDNTYFRNIRGKA